MTRFIMICTVVIASRISFGAQAATPFCSSSSGGYCQYNGKVSKIYVNSGGIILLYFENPTTVAEAQLAGFTISATNAAAYQMSTNIEFAKMLYATALAAQTSGREISIQMHGVEAGYLKISRIWLDAP